MGSPTPFWPREHGATVQVLLAVGAALALGPPSRPSLAQAGLTLVLFMASVPAGALARNPPGIRGRLALYGLAACALAALGWNGVPLHRLLHLAVPLVPASLLVLLVLRRREHSPLGEQVASLTFGLSAHPIAVLGGSAPLRAGLLATLLSAAFVLSALSVRTLQRKAVPGLGRPWTLLPPAVGLGLMGLLALLEFHPSLPLALLPAVLSTLVFTVHRPATFKQVGWILTAGTLGTAAWAVGLLR